MPFLRPDTSPAALIREDYAIDDTTALLYSAEAPLKPEPGKKDAQAVWARVLPNAQPTVLIYLHGNNNYVTVDAKGQSRVPDWAADNPAAKEGASGKPAAPLIYGLDQIEKTGKIKRPVLLVPEVATLATKSFWAREPDGQYADPQRLEKLIEDCLAHLSTLRRPDGRTYLESASMKALKRVYICGHSGAGLPIQEAAISRLILPGPTGLPSDLWLFDSTYWSKIDGFVEFCARWKSTGRLAGSDPGASRFVCIYKPGTQTEPIADILRSQIAAILGVSAGSLVMDHTPSNEESVLKPTLKRSGVQFVRTYLPHDEIPKFFIPALLQTSA